MRNHVTSRVRSIVLASLLAFVACPSKQNATKELRRPSLEGKGQAMRTSSPLSNQKAQTEPRWDAVCSFPQATFRVEFNSASGDVTEDDMTVAIRWSDDTTTPIAVKPAWFMPGVNLVSDTKNACTKIVGYVLPDKRVLLWFLRNDRPNYDQLQLLLLDINTRRVLDMQNDIGEVANNLTIVTRTAGFSVLLFKEWRLSPGDGEFGVPEWQDIVIEDGRVIARWRGETDQSKLHITRPPSRSR